MERDGRELHSYLEERTPNASTAFPDREVARCALFEYVEGFYN
jgi:hypothetical protein